MEAALKSLVGKKFSELTVTERICALYFLDGRTMKQVSSFLRSPLARMYQGHVVVTTKQVSDTLREFRNSHAGWLTNSGKFVSTY